MIESEIVTGQQSAWNLRKKLGEGDAGEVYLVDSVTGAQPAILKRPRRSAFPGDVARQAGQIRTEAKILSSLTAILRAEPSLKVRVPALLDQGKTLTNFNDRYFIVIEQATGFDLASLARITQFGLDAVDGLDSNTASESGIFLSGLAAQRQVPARVLIDILHRLVCFLERIHSLRTSQESEETWGVIWNDVKADHLFWDPKTSQLTIIDWGNAQFLEADRTTKDRKYSWVDDFAQLFEEMGRYLSTAAPDLVDRIGWPVKFSMEAASSMGISALKARLEAALVDDTQFLAEARAREEALLRGETPLGDPLSELESIQKRILEAGDAPDYAGVQSLARSLAARLAAQDQLDELQQLCEWASQVPGAEQASWRVVDQLTHIPGRSDGEQRRLFLDAIQAAVCQDWESLLWNLLLAVQDYPEPDWWQELVLSIREQALGPDAAVLRPLVAVRRLNLAFEAAARRAQDQAIPFDRDEYDFTPTLEEIQAFASQLKNEIIPSWTQLDPGPPHSSLLYGDIQELLAAAALPFPDECRAVSAAIAYPKLQVEQVLEAWDRQDFLAASRSLHRVILYDPDRRRILNTERALQAAPIWLKTVHLGPQAGENFPEWITHLELRGREMRNQVGPAGWLDAILETCRKIRRGTWPSDLLAENPILLREMPWLRHFERVESMPVLSEEESILEIPPQAKPREWLQGVENGLIGPGEAVALVEPLDAWMPEARGSSARVVLGRLRNADGDVREAAVKLMRMDKVHYALPLFQEEVKILSLLRDVPGVTRLYECGFLRLNEDSALPLDPGPAATPAVGEAQRIGVDASQEFLDQLSPRIEDGWIPYLAMEKEQQENSLLMLCDAGMTRGQFRPVIHLLQMAIQICNILDAAHQRNVVYRDHKILHYYWRPEKNGLYMIDWNVARLHPQGLSETDIHMDLVQFGARGLHHVLTGRTAPGALPLGPTRPEEIEQAAQSYQTQWTYDDQRLSEGLRSVLERVLAGSYSSAGALRDDLKQTMMQLPDARL